MIGELLKKRREELGKDLRDISEKLKIKYDYLKAIEEGEVKRLPAEVYVKGYIADYARYLNLDPEKILSEYNKEKAPPLSLPETIHKNTQKKTSVLPLIIIVIALAITATILFKFSFINNSKPKETDQYKNSVTEALNKKQNLEINKTTSTIPDSSTPNYNKPITTFKESQHELEIIADDTTWLLVITDDTETKEYLLKPGDSVKCLAKKNFSLKIGNAGGIRLIFNGKDYSNLGQKGQVVKLVLPENSS